MAENNKDDIDKVPSISNRQDNDELLDRRELGDTDDAAQATNKATEPKTPVKSPDAPPRREENPFSFKRFLNQDRGARRKEYSPDGSPVLVNTSEMSSMLPDFVQDHLVVEQSYMSSPTHHVPIPFDLPIPAEDRIDPVVQMSLPDFLSDGPIHSHSQRGEEAAAYLDNHEPSPLNGHHSSPGPSSRNEAERLQREVDSLRRQLHEKNRRIHILESEVNILHSRDARESDSLEHSLQQLENNLLQTSKRMIAAEKTAAKLKADNKILRARLEMLQVDEGAAAAGPSTSYYSSNVRNQRIAQDLRGAATAAETHLRSLMSGIENLRMMASTIEDRPNFDYDFSEGASGPAL